MPPRKAWSEFRELMGVPVNLPAINVGHVVLKPAIKEPKKPPHSENLFYKKLEFISL
ncbi:hypothetical protein [Helicobacter felis]|nr:hypothetical protein [Helicobacter felis]